VIARELSARGAVVDGVEADPVAAEGARRHCRTVLVGDAETVDLSSLGDARYDVVVMADVVEHLRDPVSAMARYRPLLSPGGRLVLSTPNIANWSMRLLHLAGRWDYTDRGIMDRTHVRFFTLKTISQTLYDAGYAINDVDVTCPLPALRRPPFSRWAHDLAMGAKGLLAYQFILVARAR
jgi:2-polyprenyl-3-methyl-5-hydroxy-6-metoxy-1,4-benzoquinol methylase